MSYIRKQYSKKYNKYYTIQVVLVDKIIQTNKQVQWIGKFRSGVSLLPSGLLYKQFLSRTGSQMGCCLCRMG